MQVLKSIRDLSKHKESLQLHFGHTWITHFGYANGLLGFCHIFLDKALFQYVIHIDDFLMLGDIQVVLGILCSCVAHQPFYFT